MIMCIYIYMHMYHVSMGKGWSSTWPLFLQVVGQQSFSFTLRDGNNNVNMLVLFPFTDKTLEKNIIVYWHNPMLIT